MDIVLLVGMGVISFVAVDALVMPSALQMSMLAVVLVLLAGFLVLVWREHPQDEREAYNQALASRVAYLTGAGVLMIALVVQSLQHHLDSVVPIALLAMITAKILVQRTKDSR